MHKLLVLLLAMLSLTACSQQAKTFDWKEEIALHDGRMIIAERLDVLGGWTEPGQTGSTQERRITFPDPDSPAKKYTHKITGSSNYLLLDFDKGVPWLIVRVGPFSTDSKCPIGTYETFTWTDGVWQSVSYAVLPKRFTSPNMTVSYGNETRKKGAITTRPQIEAALRNTKIHGTESAWKLVQTNEHGRPIDCDHYRKLAEGMKK